MCLSVAEEQANTYVAFYWGSMLVGRLIGALVLKSVKPSVMLSYSSILALLLIILSVSSTGMLAVWSMIGVGLCNSIMFAIIFSLSVDGLGRLYDQGIRHFIYSHCRWCDRLLFTGIIDRPLYLDHFIYAPFGMLSLYFILWHQRV